MRVVTYNIHGAVGLDRRRRPERIAEVLQSLDADIIGLQEVEGRRSRSRVDQARLIAESLGYNLIAGPLLLEDADGYGGGYGNVLLSRHPVLEAERRIYQRPGSQTRGLLDTVVAHPRLGRLRVIVTHLEVRNHRVRSTQLRELESLLADGPEGPAVLMGDLNEWWSRRHALRSLDRTVTFLHSPATFPARLPILRLDRIAVKALRSTDHDGFARRIDNPLTRIASDHLPLVADLEPLEALPAPRLEDRAPDEDQASDSSSLHSTPMAPQAASSSAKAASMAATSSPRKTMLVPGLSIRKKG